MHLVKKVKSDTEQLNLLYTHLINVDLLRQYIYLQYRYIDTMEIYDLTCQLKLINLY